jgi:hypothetical protein
MFISKKRKERVAHSEMEVGTGEERCTKSSNIQGMNGEKWVGGLD